MSIAKGDTDFQDAFKQSHQGIDPFDYIVRHIRAINYPKVAGSTIVVLIGLLVVHFLVASLCLTVLLLPYVRGQRTYRWLIRKLYIKDAEDRKVHPRPLYVINGGVLLAITQLLDSAFTQAYIYTAIRCFKSTEYAIRGPPLTLYLGLMYLFELYAYWIMAWCCLYTALSNEQSYAARLKSKTGILFAPLTANSFFMSFPLVITVIDAILINRLAVYRDIQKERWYDLQKILKEGSEAWLNVRSINARNASTEEKLEAWQKVMDISKQAETTGLRLKASLGQLIYNFRFTGYVWAAILSITCVVFIISVGQLLQQIHRRVHLSGRRTLFSFFSGTHSALPGQEMSDSSTTSGRQPKSTLHKQFTQLLFRAIAMVLSMLCTLGATFVTSMKAAEIVTSSHWRSTGMWLALFSGTCSAIPITIQCWRMYVDRGVLSSGSRTTSRGSAPSSAGIIDLQVVKETIPPSSDGSAPGCMSHESNFDVGEDLISQKNTETMLLVSGNQSVECISIHMPRLSQV